jgi:hypothetical protein
MATFGEYRQIVAATSSAMGQREWKLDKSGENRILRDKKGTMVAAWMGNEEKVDTSEEVLFLSEEVYESVSQRMNKIQKVKSQHTTYIGEGQSWLSGKFNPRWSLDRCVRWAKVNGWKMTEIEEKTTKASSWYVLRCFPGEASLKMVWYIGVRLGLQGKSPDDDKTSQAMVKETFLVEWKKGKEGERTEGEQVFKGMMRAMSSQSNSSGERGIGDKRGSRTPRKLGKAGVADGISITKAMANYVWVERVDVVKGEMRLEVKVVERHMNKKDGWQELSKHTQEWYVAAEE